MEIVQEAAERTANLRGKLAALEAEREAQLKKERRAKLAPLRIKAHRFADEIADLVSSDQIDEEEADHRIRVFVALNDSLEELERFEMDHLEKLVRERSGVREVAA